MGDIGGIVGGILGSSAQKDASAKNLQAARETNAQNYQMFLQGRGSQGNALLPMYFGNQEQNLSNDAGSFYNASKALLGSPSKQLQDYTQTVNGYMPMQDASRGTLGDVFNGNMTNTRLGYLQPVNAARTNLAQGQQQGIFQGLQQRINALNAQNAQKGFSGTGSFAQNRLLGATIGARQDAANALGQANLANAQDTRGVQDQGMNLRLQMMNQPYQLATQALNLQMQPMNQVQQNFTRSLAPFDFFRMSPGAFQNAPLPQVNAIPGLGQILATGLGNGAQQVGNYFAQKQLGNQYQQMMNGYGYGGGAGYDVGYGTSGWGGGAAAGSLGDGAMMPMNIA